MTKEEKIQSEWDKLTPNSQLHICKNTGFVITYCINGIDDLIDNSIIKELDIEFEYLESDLIKWRLKSLSGIENNNGWIKIESEADLPKAGEYDTSSFKLIYWTNNGIYCSEDYKRHKLHYDNLKISHYQLLQIQKPKPPMY